MRRAIPTDAVLTFKLGLRRHHVHLLTTGCYQFCRLLRTPEDERYVAVSHRGERLPDDLEEDMRGFLPPYIEGRQVGRLSGVFYRRTSESAHPTADPDSG